MNTEPVTFWPDEDPVDPVGGVRRADLPVTTVLRPCVVVAVHEPITAAWSRMREHGEVALVVDEATRVVGLLGLREVSELWPARPPLSAEPTAADALRGVRTCRIPAATTIRDAIRQLIAGGRGAAAVVTADGRARGLVTALDLLTALGQPEFSGEPGLSPVSAGPSPL